MLLAAAVWSLAEMGGRGWGGESGLGSNTTDFHLSG